MSASRLSPASVSEEDEPPALSGPLSHTATRVLDKRKITKPDTDATSTNQKTATLSSLIGETERAIHTKHDVRLRSNEQDAESSDIADHLPLSRPQSNDKSAPIVPDNATQNPNQKSQSKHHAPDNSQSHEHSKKPRRGGSKDDLSEGKGQSIRTPNMQSDDFLQVLDSKQHVIILTGKYDMKSKRLVSETRSYATSDVVKLAELHLCNKELLRSVVLVIQFDLDDFLSKKLCESNIDNLFRVILADKAISVLEFSVLGSSGSSITQVANAVRHLGVHCPLGSSSKCAHTDSLCYGYRLWSALCHGGKILISDALGWVQSHFPDILIREQTALMRGYIEYNRSRPLEKSPSTPLTLTPFAPITASVSQSPPPIRTPSSMLDSFKSVSAATKRPVPIKSNSEQSQAAPSSNPTTHTSRTTCSRRFIGENIAAIRPVNRWTRLTSVNGFSADCNPSAIIP